MRGAQQTLSKQYAKLMQRHADLRGKIAAHEAAAETATLEFKQLLAAAI